MFHPDSNFTGRKTSILRSTYTMILISVLLLAAGETESHSKEMYLRMCGGDIWRGMAFICGGVYHGYKKKNDIFANPLDPSSKGRNDVLQPPIPAVEHIGYRNRRRIADECCNKKGCPLSQLQLYCAQPPSPLLHFDSKYISGEFQTRTTTVEQIQFNEVEGGPKLTTAAIRPTVPSGRFIYHTTSPGTQIIYLP